jgi:hypothetical protein
LKTFSRGIKKMGLFKSSFKRLRKLLKRRERNAPLQTSRNYGSYAVVLLNPAYEHITNHMRMWTNGLKTPKGLSRQQSLSGSAVNRNAVLLALQNMASPKRIEIFCGHGVKGALLGPPQTTGPIIKVGGSNHSPIYDAQLLKAINNTGSAKAGSAALFAFCCSAGAEFGKKFCSFKDNTFLGYSEELPIETENDQCLNALKKIFQTISAEIIEAGEVLPEHEQRLKSLYHEAYLYFFQGEGRHNKRARYMWLALNEHRRFVCRYGGSL